MLIDTHAHLDFPDFNEDIEEVIMRAKKSGVGKIVNIGADLALSSRAIEIAEKYENIWATVGVHAEYTEDHQLDDLKRKISELVLSSKKVVAVGECGPDYNWNDKNKAKQLELFRIQIQVARENDLPLVCHIRNGGDESAAEDAYQILREEKVEKGVVHCFTLNKKWVKRFVDLGLLIGYTGIVTYKNALDVREAVAATPLERMLIETDAPYLAPQSVRGKRNEPAYVVEVAGKVAEIKGISLENLASATTQNANNLFNI